MKTRESNRRQAHAKNREAAGGNHHKASAAARTVLRAYGRTSTAATSPPSRTGMESKQDIKIPYSICDKISAKNASPRCYCSLYAAISDLLKQTARASISLRLRNGLPFDENLTPVPYAFALPSKPRCATLENLKCSRHEQRICRSSATRERTNRAKSRVRVTVLSLSLLQPTNGRSHSRQECPCRQAQHVSVVCHLSRAAA